MRGNGLSNGLGLALEWLGLACLLPMRGQLNCRSSCSIFHGTFVLRLYSDCTGLRWDWLDCMNRENNFFACDSCEWSNTNYNECLCPLPWCPVSHFLFLSAVRDDLNWWEVVSVHPFGVVLWLYNHTSCMILLLGISPQSCTETDFEMKTSNFVLFLLISVVSVHFRAIYDETKCCQA